MSEKYPTKRAYAKPKLKAFLIEKNVYKQFLYNCKNEPYNKVNKNAKFFDNLDSAFIWRNTQEGHEFWMNLEGERCEQIRVSNKRTK